MSNQTKPNIRDLFRIFPISKLTGKLPPLENILKIGKLGGLTKPGKFLMKFEGIRKFIQVPREWPASAPAHCNYPIIWTRGRKHRCAKSLLSFILCKMIRYFRMLLLVLSLVAAVPQGARYLLFIILSSWSCLISLCRGFNNIYGSGLNPAINPFAPFGETDRLERYSKDCKCW